MILEHADKTGVKKSAAAAAALHERAKTLRVVRLPGQEETADKHGKDVSDWLDADPARRRDHLAEACFDAPLWSNAEEPALRYVDMSAWDSEPVPSRQWAVEGRIPLKQVFLHTGNGGTGKSLAELMRSCAHVLGADWFGMPVRQGPAIYMSGEDDKDELHIRLSAIAAHYGTTFAELKEGDSICSIMPVRTASSAPPIAKIAKASFDPPPCFSDWRMRRSRSSRYQ